MQTVLLRIWKYIMTEFDSTYTFLSIMRYTLTLNTNYTWSEVGSA